MAKKKMNTGTKLLIGAGVVIAGVLIYKLVRSGKNATPYGGIYAPPYTPPATNPASGETLSNITSIVDSLKNIFKGSGTVAPTTTSGGGTSTYNPADYGMTYIAGRRPLMGR